MASTSTTRLGLFKPVPGTAEPFRASDFNENMDKIDAEAVAVDTRLDAAEAALVSADSRLDAIEEILPVLDIELKTVTGTSYTLIANDARDSIRFTSDSDITLTVADVLAVNDFVNILKDGDGTITFVAGAGVTISSPNSRLKLQTRYAWASIIKVAAGQYRLVGELAL